MIDLRISSQCCKVVVVASSDFHTTEVDLSFGGLRGREVKKQDPPIERDLNLALEDLFHGCTKKIKISRRVRCSNIALFLLGTTTSYMNRNSLRHTLQ